MLDNEPQHATFIKKVLFHHRHWFSAYSRALGNLNPTPSGHRFTYLAEQLRGRGFTQKDQRILIGRAGNPSRQQLIADTLKKNGVYCELVFHDMLFGSNNSLSTTAEFIIEQGLQGVQFDCMVQVNYYSLPSLSHQLTSSLSCGVSLPGRLSLRNAWA